MKEAAGFPAVDQGQAPRGGQGVGMFSGRRRVLLHGGFVAEKPPSDAYFKNSCSFGTWPTLGYGLARGFTSLWIVTAFYTLALVSAQLRGEKQKLSGAFAAA